METLRDAPGQTTPILRGLPRRAPLATGGVGAAQPAQMRAAELPAAKVLDVVARLLVWSPTFFVYLCTRSLDRLRGRYSPAWRGRRLRRILTRLGPPAVKVGRLFGARLDLLPAGICSELASLSDEQPPLPIAQVVGQLEAAAGLPLESVFSALDPDPVRSDYGGCVYQAVLCTGEPVWVRVARPGAGRRTAADLTALGVLLHIMELLTIVRPGFLGHVRADLDALLATELDLVQAARHHRLFSRYARKAGLRHATALRTYPQLSGEDVLVSERPVGVLLSEILAACERDDPEALRRLAELGIRPDRVGRRLLQTTWWSIYEGLFCDLTLDPSTILVQPGERLVFCAFPGAGASPTPKRELHAEALRRLAARDVSGAADALVQLLSPLPFIDVNGFRKRVETRLWTQLLAMEDKAAPALDRTSIGVWRALLDVARAERVPVHMDALRLMIASSSAEGMVATLRLDLDLLGEFERYSRQADRRRARAFARGLARTLDRDPQAMIVARVADASQTLNRLWFWLETTSRTLPVDYVSLSSKGAYALSILLRLTLLVGLVALVVAGARQAGLDGELPVGGALAHPVTMAVAVVLTLLALRRILFRLNDLDEA